MRGFLVYKVTLFLLITNSAIFLFSLFLSHFHFDISMDVLYVLGGASWQSVIEQNEWSRVVASMFLHANIIHFATNMISLFYVGSLAELCYKKVRILASIFFGGIIGTLVYLFLVRDEMVVGASGAIFALFGSLVGYYVVHKSLPFFNSSEAKKKLLVYCSYQYRPWTIYSKYRFKCSYRWSFMGLLGSILIAKMQKTGEILFLFFSITTILLLSSIML